jgi:hypothetical protein
LKTESEWSLGGLSSCIFCINEIKEFNWIGWIANQNYLFKKAGLEFLSQAYIDKFNESVKGNPIAALNAFALVENYMYEKLNKRLLSDGWKFDGNSPADKTLAIYTKDKFTINLKLTTELLFGTIVDAENSTIWEN